MSMEFNHAELQGNLNLSAKHRKSHKYSLKQDHVLIAAISQLKHRCNIVAYYVNLELPPAPTQSQLASLKSW